MSPIFLMECINCGTREDVLVHHSEKDSVICNRCDTKMVEIPTAPTFIIKGFKSKVGVTEKNYE